MGLASMKKMNARRKQEIIGLLMILVAILTLGSLASSSDNDELYFMPGSTSGIADVSPENGFGYAGMFFSHYAYALLGLIAFFIPVWLGLRGGRLLLKWKNDKHSKRLYLATGLFFFVAVLVALSAVNPPIHNVTYTESLGGLVAHVAASLISRIFGMIGAILIGVVAVLVFIMLLVEWRPKKWEQKIRGLPAWFKDKSLSLFRQLRPEKTVQKAAGDSKELSFWQKLWRLDFDFLGPSIGRKDDSPEVEESESYARSSTPPPSESFVTDYSKIRDEVIARDAQQKGQDQADLFGGKSSGKSDSGKPFDKIMLKRGPEAVAATDYQFPTLDLLEDNPQPVMAVSRAEMQQTADDLLRTLKTFGVEVDSSRIERYPGPVITRYEFKPAAGIKVNQIVNLADDLALALRAKRIRIIAPVPGKAAVGVEIPNKDPQTVYLKDILKTDDYNDLNIRLPMALGRTISGEPFVADLAEMPHLLVAGSTGSGKSVCLNGIITSLMYRHSPDSLRFLFVDPKMLELTVYQGLPHLERPVVTTPRKAERLLNDAVGEMEGRYKKLASENVRSIEDYNAKVDSENRLPYIVIIVDELADLMMSNSSTCIETLITRLAQMARAVGIHLILATQRPSVDVITGLIKANFPARIAFQVATRVDSRTILDGNGAEKLLGRGDMLFQRPGQPEYIRVHGSNVSSEETNAIMDAMRTQAVEVEKIDNFTEENSKKRQEDLGKDPLLREAAELVVKHKQGSVSLLQRRLGIGYQRAARLIDQLEEKSIVGMYDGSKAREVLIDEAHLTRLLKIK